MRIGHLDESGTGDPDDEPWAVMAGVLVNADLQWKKLETYLQRMVAEHLPHVPKSKQVFHASQIWTGNGVFGAKRFRDKWPRRMILLELCMLPKQFDLPVVWACIDRKRYRARWPNLTHKQAIAAELALCSVQCLAVIERYMRGRPDDEVAMVFYENNNTSRAFIKRAQDYLRGSPAPEVMRPAYDKYFPLKQVISTAHFEEKTDNSVLQLSDALAYALARKLRNAEDCDYLYEDIKPQLVVTHKSWAPNDAAS